MAINKRSKESKYGPQAAPGGSTNTSGDDVMRKRNAIRAFEEFYGTRGDQSAAAPKGAERGSNRTFPMRDRPLSPRVEVEERATDLNMAERRGTPVAPTPVDQAEFRRRRLAPVKTTPFGQTRRTQSEYESEFDAPGTFKKNAVRKGVR